MNLEEITNDTMRIKVMNFNVLHGFHTPENVPFEPPFTLNEQRLKAGQETVLDENPDILVLTEACFGGRGYKGVKMDYQKLFGFPHFHYTQTPGEWGYAVLSKFPIIASEENIKHFQPHIRTQIDSHGKILTLDIAHPHPSLTEDEKIRYLGEMLKTHPSKNYILLGDLNSLSHQDLYDKNRLIEGFRKVFGENTQAIIDGMLRGKTIPYITSQGLIDTHKAIHPNGIDSTIPTDYLSEDKRSGIRIDYIFCSPDLKIEDAYVVKNNSTNQASDHYPVVAVLNTK